MFMYLHSFFFYVYIYIYICIMIYIIYIHVYLHTYVHIYIYMYLYCYPILPTAEFVVFQCPEGQFIDLVSPGSCLVVAPRGRPSHLEYI